MDWLWLGIALTYYLSRVAFLVVVCLCCWVGGLLKVFVILLELLF